MNAWNFATEWEILAANIPDAPAIIQGDRVVTWGEFDRRADALAATLLERGATAQDKVALYLYNGPEYLEGCHAAFKAGLVPVNTNYRYAEDELAYLWDNADAVAVIFHASLAEHAERLRTRMEKVTTWIWVDDDGSARPEWALDYEAIVSAEPAERPTVAPWGRGDDDLLMIYTGGTTGMPKGVMWRQDDLMRGVVGAASRRLRGPADYESIRETFTRPGRVGLPACPLMHGTGWFSALAVLATGGAVVLLDGRRFDPIELFDTYERRRVYTSSIVGDALAKPMLAALDAEPDRWDLSELTVLNSSGVMWSAPVKQGLLAHLPHVQLIDNFGSSEAMGMAQSVTTSAGSTDTARFTVSDKTRVIDDDLREVRPGSGTVGRVAVRGHQPLGYYKDPDKSATTFVTIDGDRYSIPGDYATVAADGTLELLGRGSVCINTGGEKVFPEEVEEALKLQPGVNDAVVVGVPHERFGESVAAVVEPVAGVELDEDDLIEQVKARIASYKAPKQVIVVDTIGRSPNGKVDYRHLRQLAVEQLSPPA